MTRTAPAKRASVEPWYRQRWPWLLIGGPAIVVVASFVTLWLAIASDDGLVADDYYKEGLAINKDLARERRGETAGIGATVAIAADGIVRVDLSAADPSVAPPTIRLRLVHPTRAGRDTTLAMARAADGSYRGNVPSFAPNRWLMSIETDAWRLPSVEAVAPGETRLGAERSAR